MKLQIIISLACLLPFSACRYSAPEAVQSGTLTNPSPTTNIIGLNYKINQYGIDNYTQGSSLVYHLKNLDLPPRDYQKRLGEICWGMGLINLKIKDCLNEKIIGLNYNVTFNDAGASEKHIGIYHGITRQSVISFSKNNNYVVITPDEDGEEIFLDLR